MLLRRKWKRPFDGIISELTENSGMQRKEDDITQGRPLTWKTPKSSHQSHDDGQSHKHDGETAGRLAVVFFACHNGRCRVHSGRYQFF